VSDWSMSDVSVVPDTPPTEQPSASALSHASTSGLSSPVLGSKYLVPVALLFNTQLYCGCILAISNSEGRDICSTSETLLYPSLFCVGRI
jgi:hypothetical protein